MISDSELKELEEPGDALDEDAFSIGRLVTVAAVGALLSLGTYYIYQQMDPEKKARLKKKATSMITEQIHALTDIGEE